MAMAQPQQQSQRGWIDSKEERWIQLERERQMEGREDQVVGLKADIKDEDPRAARRKEEEERRKVQETEGDWRLHGRDPWQRSPGHDLPPGAAPPEGGPVQMTDEQAKEKMAELKKQGHPDLPAHLRPGTKELDRAEVLARQRQRLEKEKAAVQEDPQDREEALRRSKEDTERALDDAALVISADEDYHWTQSGLYVHTADPDYIVELTEDNYEEVVEAEKLPIIIDAWTPHCTDSLGATATLKMLVRRANSGPQGTLVKLCTLHCDRNYNLALHLGVHSLPLALAVRDCRVLEHQSGLVDEEQSAQFVFGFCTAVYGDEVLNHLSEDEPGCMLIDARVALKAEDWNTSWEKYLAVYKTAMKQYQKEAEEREEQKKEGIFHPLLTRPISEAEVLAAKAAAGMMVIAYNRGQFRHVRNLMRHLETDHKKAYTTLADVQKIVATLDILMLSGYKHTDDIEDLEDEERIDQHNLDVKLRLCGAYFMGGQYIPCMSKCCVLIRKNFQWRDNAALHIARRVFRYLGKHHPAVEDYQERVEEALKSKFCHDFNWNARIAAALCLPGAHHGPLEHEIPKLVSPGMYLDEKPVARHPQLR